VCFRFDCLFTPPSRQPLIGIRVVLFGKELIRLERRHRGPGKKMKPHHDSIIRTTQTNNQEDDKLRASGGLSLEDLMRRLEKLTGENNKIRRKAKGKKTKGGSSSSEDEDFSLEEDVSKKGKNGRNNCDKPFYNSMSFNYDNMPNTTAYTFIPISKAPYFDGTCYKQWKHCMKNYLYFISPEVW
jgi:hypothetical protein